MKNDASIAAATQQLYNCDCQDGLDWLKDQLDSQKLDKNNSSRLDGRVAAIFMDPPDNLGLDYEDDPTRDRRNVDDYYNWLELLIAKAMSISQIVWISYYWSHDLEIKHRVRNILKYRHPAWEHKMFLWRFTFSQYQDKDCAVGFRYLMRLTGPGAVLNVNEIREPSVRELIGDKRAKAGGRVPDTVWEYPRIVGNSTERRPWHPTQHPEDLVARIMSMSVPQGGTLIDIFAGSGTSLRVGQKILKSVIAFEQSETYCTCISQDLRIPVKKL